MPLEALCQAAVECFAQLCCSPVGLFYLCAESCCVCCESCVYDWRQARECFARRDATRPSHMASSNRRLERLPLPV